MNSTAGLQPAAAAASNTALLEITGGLHQGCSLGLSRPSYEIGRHSGADLVLHDSAVAEHHLRLRLDGEHVRIEARGGAVGVHPAAEAAFELPQGQGTRARLPLRLQVGQAQLRLTAQGASSTPAWRKPQALLALAPVLLCGAVLAYNSGEPEGEDLSVLLPPTAAAPRHAPDMVKAQAWFDGQLQQAGLAGIRTEASGHQLTAQGNYNPGQRAQWAAVQQAFDKRYGQQVVLAGNVAEATASPTPRVRFQAVWFGNNPYVIDGSGRHLYPGAALEDRWMLERIEGDQVVLLRDGERFTFTL